MSPKEMYFEANLIKCNSDAKFPGYPWDERKIFMRILERESVLKYMCLLVIFDVVEILTHRY